jgi:hypothetical protein
VRRKVEPQVPPLRCPEFPVQLSLNFSQISRPPITAIGEISRSVANDGCPISARFWQMWDSTALDRPFFLLQRIPRSMIICTMHNQWSGSAESHICQNRADMGHPSFVTDTERRLCEKSRLVALANFTQLSLRKAAYVAVFPSRSVRRNPLHSVRRA